MLDSLNIQGEHLKVPGKTREALTWVDKFMEMPDAHEEPGVRQEHGQPQESTAWSSRAKQFEKKGNFKECGRSMLAAAESMPDHPKHAERL